MSRVCNEQNIHDLLTWEQKGIQMPQSFRVCNRNDTTVFSGLENLAQRCNEFGKICHRGANVKLRVRRLQII